MIRFDLSTLPNDISDTDIKKAELSLYSITDKINSTEGNHDSGTVCLISRSWKVDETTWINAISDNEWNEVGGDYNQDAITTVGFVEKNNWENYVVTSAVKELIKNPDSNYGFIIITALNYKDVSDESSPDRFYISSDYTGNIEQRPKLVVTYESQGISYFASSPVFRNDISIKITPEGIKFYIPFNGTYTVTLTDLKGRQIISFYGNYKRWYKFPSTLLSAGMHIIGIKTEGKTALRKFLFIK